MSSFKWLLRLAVALLMVWVLNRAFDLINMADDFAVAGGIAVIAAEVWFAAWWFRKTFGPNEASSRSNGTGSFILILCASLVVGSSGCYTVVEPGHAGIKVNMSGGERGVSDYTVTTGRVFYNPITTSVFQYPTFVQTAVWTKDTAEGHPANEEINFNSKEGTNFTADISLSYQIDPSKVPAFYVKFRNDDIDKFTHGFLRNVARDGFNEIGPMYTTEEIYGPKMGEIVDKVRARINAVVVPFGVEVQQFGFIGAPRPPKSIVDALNSKVQAIQDADRAVNKLQQTKAEADMAVAKAEGEAKANQALTSSLTANLLEWRQLQIQEQTIAKWNGQLPQFSGGGIVPMIQLPSAMPGKSK